MSPNSDKSLIHAILVCMVMQMKYKLYLVDVYENLQVEQVEADTETVALDLLALAARLNEFEPIGVELAA